MHWKSRLYKKKLSIRESLTRWTAHVLISFSLLLINGMYPNHLCSLIPSELKCCISFDNPLRLINSYFIWFHFQKNKLKNYTYNVKIFCNFFSFLLTTEIQWTPRPHRNTGWMFNLDGVITIHTMLNDTLVPSSSIIRQTIWVSTHHLRDVLLVSISHTIFTGT